MNPASPAMRTALLTAVAMLAFAANSLLCRMALGAQAIDAASFTGVRLAAGAAMLGAIALVRRRGLALGGANWAAVLALFIYMASFSFAYLSLSAGTGALILFGAVQSTMFLAALARGERFTALAWLGLGLAIGGVVYLVLPGVAAPPPVGALLMAIAGIAWGVYSLAGRGAADPLAETAANFLLALPLAAAVSLNFTEEFSVGPAGIGLAVASGALASGLGYAVWYAALPRLSAGKAAAVQLAVPPIAAFGGALLLGEPLTLRLLLASALTLGGIALVLAQRGAAPRG